MINMRVLNTEVSYGFTKNNLKRLFKKIYKKKGSSNMVFSL